MFNKDNLLSLQHINSLSDCEKEELKEQILFPIMWNTEVTLDNKKNKVSQILCSAIPTFNLTDQFYAEKFCQLVLEASYEATILAAILNNNPKCFITLLGGGAFCNKKQWILGAIENTLIKYKNCGLQIFLNNYKDDTSINEFVKCLNAKINN